MLAGLGRTRRVLLGDTLLTASRPRKSRSIFAHEIGHHVFRHIRKMIVAGVFYSAAGFWVCDRLLAAWAAHGGGPSIRRTAGLYPAAGAADSDALRHVVGAAAKRHQPAFRAAVPTATPSSGPDCKDAYLSAFRKLAKLNKDDPNPHWLDVLLFHSHPPVAQRLAMAEGILRIGESGRKHGASSRRLTAAGVRGRHAFRQLLAAGYCSDIALPLTPGLPSVRSQPAHQHQKHGQHRECEERRRSWFAECFELASGGQRLRALSADLIEVEQQLDACRSPSSVSLAMSAT